ncbi:predicted protein [Naegleria gruberi]|uniref:Predicted protein n=1 Tax=Naegleria gruberi TaxID=5762 RepID=D2VCH2_NAEGR|nr:uncharacterized protein NAEGRDRAFT_66570 [Naegleria gruberi]EFC45309.1 predicted protein [Naegleria gruberi]|eukprot:XP_002678053.1 predicted protein [Naegleria gruberi strain NEG-M]
MPSTLDEFERNGYCNVDEFVDFEHPNRVPFFLACQSLTNSVKTFRPTIVNLTFTTSRYIKRYSLDESYKNLLNRFWFNQQCENRLTYDEWPNIVQELIRKMKRFCKGNPWSRVEFISISAIVGKNYSNTGVVFFNWNDIVFNFFPTVKYMLFDFPSIRIFNLNEYKNSGTIIFSYPEDYYITTLKHVDNIYYSCKKDIVQTESQLHELAHAFPSHYPRNVELFLFNSILSYSVQESNYLIDNFELNINLFSYIWNVRGYNAVVNKTYTLRI